MTKLQAGIIAFGLWLVAVALVIPFAAMWSEYTSLRDGAHINGTITSVEPHSSYVTAIIGYVQDGRPGETRMYPSLAEAGHYGVGTQIPLLCTRSSTIRASQLDDEKPSVLLLLGAAVAMALGVLVWKLPRWDAARRAQRLSPFEAIIDGVRRTRNIGIAGSVMFTIFGVFIAAVPLMDTEGETWQLIVVEVVALASLGLAAYLGATAFRLRDPQNNPLVDMIVNRPHEIAWIYVHVQRNRYGVEVKSAMIWKTDGKPASIRLVPEDVEPVIAELARRAPHARRGYDRETEKQYRENPMRWLPAR